jgi:hypothetical protein
MKTTLFLLAVALASMGTGVTVGHYVLPAREKVVTIYDNGPNSARLAISQSPVVGAHSSREAERPVQRKLSRDVQTVPNQVVEQASLRQRVASSATSEPSEESMRQALQDKLDTFNTNVEAARQRPISRDDPIGALATLSAAAMGNTSVSIAAFKKLDCAPAVGMPGYMCDYTAQLSATGNNPYFNQILSQLSGELVSARFIRGPGGWILMNDR